MACNPSLDAARGRRGGCGFRSMVWHAIIGCHWYGVQSRRTHCTAQTVHAFPRRRVELSKHDLFARGWHSRSDDLVLGCLVQSCTCIKQQVRTRDKQTHHKVAKPTYQSRALGYKCVGVMFFLSVVQMPGYVLVPGYFNTCGWSRLYLILKMMTPAKYIYGL